MSYAYLKIKDVRLTGADFETEEYSLQYVVNNNNQGSTVNLRRNHYAILNIQLLEKSYTTEFAVSVVLTAVHTGLNVASGPSTFSMNFSSSTEWGTTEKELSIVHPSDGNKVQTIVVVYEFTPFPALIAEYKDMVDCLKRLHEFRDVFSDNQNALDLLNTLETDRLSDLFSAYEAVANALAVAGESYSSSLNLSENVINLAALNEEVHIAWNESTIGSTLINSIRSEFTNFKNAFEQLMQSLAGMNLFLCDKYYRWKGPGELFDNYEELVKCLCQYESQYLTLTVNAKNKVDSLRIDMSNYLTQIYDYAFSKGYPAGIPSPNPTNMCDLYKYIKDILSWLRTDYNRKLA